MPLTAQQLGIRRKQIAKWAERNRKSVSMREIWEERRRERMRWLEDGDTESAGSPDHDLAELPEVMG